MRNLFGVLIAGAVLLCFTVPYANGQVGSFDDIRLDGGGLDPFMSFDQPNGDRHYAVGFQDSLQFFVTDNYKFSIEEGGKAGGLTLNSDGARIRDRARIVTDAGTQRPLIIDPAGAEAYGLITISGTSGGVGLYSNTNDFPFWMYNNTKSATFALSAAGVGIGRYDAREALHVYADGSPFSDASILVENNLATTALRDMFKLVNNGGSRFSFEDTKLNSKWIFQSDSIGSFSISLDATGGPEMVVFPSGRVTMGPGPVSNFDLRANGNLHIPGTLFQSSDRNLKTAVQNVDHREILEKVAAMPVTTWQFKSDVPEQRHIGPMSQDFNAAFALGPDETTIAPVDGIGISLSAIKALKQLVDQKDQQLVQVNETLLKQQQQLDDQQQQIEEQQNLVEELLTRLQSMEQE